MDRVVKLETDEADLAIRYARSLPHGASGEIFRDSVLSRLQPRLLAKQPIIQCASDLRAYQLIHFDWFAKDQNGAQLGAMV